MNNTRDQAYIKGFGEHLRKLRKGANLSQEEFGYAANIGKNQVGLIERGEVNVTLSTLNALAKALKIRPSELLDFY